MMTMIRGVALTSLAVLLACGDGAPQPDDPPEETELPGEPQTADGTEFRDHLVSPDERVSLVLDDTTEGELIEQVGASNLMRREAHVGEGFCAPATVLFSGTENEYEVLWTDTTYSQPAAVRISRAGSRWRTNEGVQIGTTLEELERMRGEPVEFSGFGWDYGGTATWSDATDSEDRILLQLAPEPDSMARAATDPRYGEVLGEQTIRSDHPLVRRLGIRVERITLLMGRNAGEHQCRLP
jgi:hypothetical protein